MKIKGILSFIFKLEGFFFFFFFFFKSKIEIFNLIYIRKSNSYPSKRRSQLGEWDTTGQMPNEYLKC